MISKILSLLNRREKKLLIALGVFSIFVSFIEMAGISVIMPFVAVAGDFTLIQNNKYFRFFYDFFGFSSNVNFVVGFGLVLIAFYLLRSLINAVFFYSLARFSRGRYHILAFRLFENYLGMSYKNFTSQNSSTLTKAIITEASSLTSIIYSFLLILSEIFVVVLIYAMMIYVNAKITLLLTLILLVNAGLIFKLLIPKIDKAGIKRESIQSRFYEIINSSLGNFKMIKLRGNANKILDKFSNASLDFARVNTFYEAIKHLPRLILEAVSFIILIFIVIFLVLKYKSDISSAMALISMFVLGLYRLMPSANRITDSYNNIVFLKKSLDIVHNHIFYDSEDLSQKQISFTQKIELKNIDFSYEENKQVFINLSLSIKRGEKIALIGTSGGGKSTLVDIICGLYRPNKGSILIDGVLLSDENILNWRKKFGYIPQSIYLFDGTVAQNIVLEALMDEQRLITVLKQAKIYDFLEKNHKGIYTRVGEGGILLSGGQKQRLAIARALYDSPEILILDEATSALDEETESSIMNEIYEIASDKTLIIIAHRLSTIRRCERVFEIENKNIKEIK